MMSTNRMAHAESTTPLHPLLAERARFLAFVTRHVRDAAAAEDVLQDAFLKAHDRAHALRDDESVEAWFYRILRNAIVDRARRASAYARASEAFAADRAMDQAVDPAVDPAVSLDGEALRETACACVEMLLPTLTPAQQTMVREVDLRERPVQALADELGIERNAAYVRLHRARKALRDALVRCCGGCADGHCARCDCTPS